jgi:hypothetical protein
MTKSTSLYKYIKHKPLFEILFAAFACKTPLEIFHDDDVYSLKLQYGSGL